MRLIDADALKASYIVPSTTTNSLCYLYVSLEDINNAPTIEAEPVRRGRWKVWHHGVIGSSYSCTECGTPIGWPAEYCPGCGAKMEEQE